MKKIIPLLIMIVTLSMTVCPLVRSGEEVHNILFIDDSGSMSPYYQDKQERLLKLIKKFVKKGLKSEDVLKIFQLSQSQSFRTDPVPLVEGVISKFNDKTFLNAIQRRTQEDQYPSKTDLNAVVTKGIQLLNSNEGIIWILTDNIVDPQGQLGFGYDSQMDQQDVRIFLERLRDDNVIRRVVCYPVKMSIEDPRLKYSYLMLYGLLYSKEDISHNDMRNFSKRMESPQIRDVLMEAPMVIKPLEIGLRSDLFNSYEQISPQNGISIENGAILGRGLKVGQSAQVVLNGNLDVPPLLSVYRIKNIELSGKILRLASSDPAVRDLPQEAVPKLEIERSSDGGVSGFQITLNFPQLSSEVFSESMLDDNFHVTGDLELKFSDLDFELDPDYLKRAKGIYAFGMMAEMFKPIIKDDHRHLRIPIDMEFQYQPWRFWLFPLSLLIVFSLAGFVLWCFLRTTQVEISIDGGEPFSFQLRPLISGETIFAPKDETFVLGVMRLNLTGKVFFRKSELVKYANGESRGNYFKFNEGDSITLIYEDEDYHEQMVNITRNSGEKRSPQSVDGEGDLFNEELY